MHYNIPMKRLKLTLILLLSLLTVCGCSVPAPPLSGTAVTVHYIDVGQGDSALIISGDHAMLIDGGPRSASDTVTGYLKSQGIGSLDYIIASHPHEDHIGGLPSVFDAFQVENILMPKITTDTKIFLELLEAIDEEGIKPTVPVPGTRVELADGVSFTVLAPPEDADDGNLNNCSVVLLIEAGGASFLFTGDMEEKAERWLLDNCPPGHADVLKTGHHGSKTSTTSGLLDEIEPDYAVISCGADNRYGHPHASTLRRLEDYGVTVFRTDLNGTVVIGVDNGMIEVVTTRDALRAG